MKQRIYLRLGKDGNKIAAAASVKQIFEPISKGASYSRRYIPTVTVALDVEIDDSEFDLTRLLLNLKLEKTKAAAQIKQVMP